MTVEQTRVHPETGAELVRGVRHITLKYRSQEQEIELPGWYPTDDPTADQGLHDAKDMKVSDRAVNTMKAREFGLMTPDQIKKVRSSLRLTQRAASSLIGGGPNAFQKYEAGDVVLSKVADSVLRLLKNKPDRLKELKRDDIVA
jgi:HTH-type transcriptional regulator/antitoxin MqsA